MLFKLNKVAVSHISTVHPTKSWMQTDPRYRCKVKVQLRQRQQSCHGLLNTLTADKTPNSLLVQTTY